MTINKSSKLYLKFRKGFTLVEILFVLAIIGGLMVFLLPRIFRGMKQANIRRTRMSMQAVKEQLFIYRQDMGDYPTTRDGGLQLLIKGPKPRGNWSGPYIDEMPKDAWGNEVEYFNPPRDRVYGKFELVSYGPDGEESEDDIIVGEKEISAGGG